MKRKYKKLIIQILVLIFIASWWFELYVNYKIEKAQNKAERIQDSLQEVKFETKVSSWGLDLDVKSNK